MLIELIKAQLEWNKKRHEWAINSIWRFLACAFALVDGVFMSIFFFR